MSDLLGLNLEGKDLNLVQICLRGFIVFVVMVRVADRRFLAKLSAFDVILGFLLASMMARAVNGSAAFLPTLAGGFVLVFLHRAVAVIAYYSDSFGRLVKGARRLLSRQVNARVCGPGRPLGTDGPRCRWRRGIRSSSARPRRSRRKRSGLTYWNRIPAWRAAGVCDCRDTWPRWDEP